MLLKDHVFALRQNLSKQTGHTPSTGHTYELFAVLLGYDSFASLTSQAFIVSLRGASRDVLEDVYLLSAGAPDLDRVLARHLKLQAAGDPHAIVSASFQYAEIHELAAIPITRLLQHYGDDRDTDKTIEYAFEGLMDCVLGMEQSQLQLPLAMLEDACVRDSRLHYPLFHLYQGLLENHGEDSSYWLKQKRSGRVLTQVERAFADQALFTQSLNERAAFHLGSSVALGHPDAIIDWFELALLDGKPIEAETFNRLEQHADVPGFSSRVAAIAEHAGMHDEALRWSYRAAPTGDVASMRQIVTHTMATPTVDTWTWIYLSRLLGRDVTESNLRAYHDGGLYDGQEYDDDYGGSLYVDGDEGLDVAPLTPDQDALARHTASALFDQMRDGGF
ncbi:hypothetical protein [Pseudomonas cichorii]|uniref:Uncharacterized protein n=1 Tax=Pseudomonas cichorii TaxID=36746 RepID=A0A3M4WF50_PSECI|nr:hypothetical protein [Pseudomonas cichorii]RMR62259.1 hypothetical protein ALP84_200011 [Pseudomonas cichorii]